MKRKKYKQPQRKKLAKTATKVSTRSTINSDRKKEKFFIRIYNNNKLVGWLGILIPIGFTIFFVLWEGRDKLTGGVLFTLKSEAQWLNETNGVEWTDNSTLFTSYIHLINKGKDPIFIKDYTLEVDQGYGWVFLKRYPHVEKFLSKNLNKLPIKFRNGNFFEKMVYNKQAVIEAGKDLNGWIMLMGDPSYNAIFTKKYRLTCIDLDDNKIELINDMADGKNIITKEQIQELSGIDLDNIPMWIYPN